MFRKSNLLFALAFLSGTATAQDSESIASIFSNQGLTLDVVSTSQDQSTFAGISKETSSLIVAQKKTGNYKLPEKIDSSLIEGAFRPEGYSENEYLFFSVYDASSLLIQNKSYLINSTYTRRVRKNSYLYNFPWASSTYGYYVSQNPSLYGMKNIQPITTSIIRKGKIIESRKIRTIDLFTETNSLLVFLDDVSSFIRLNLDGTIASKTEIELKEPIFWSNKGRGVVKDEVTNEYYIYTETNFSYNWYSLNSETGATKFITKMNDVWENPNFRIENGILNYDKLKGGVMQTQTINLIKK
jgi:hypothetical protein